MRVRAFLVSATALIAVAMPSTAGAVVPTGPASTWIPDGEVEAVVTSGNTAWIGGNFSRIAPYTGTTARFRAGSTDADTTWPVVEGFVSAVLSDGNGGWYLGGLFNAVDTQPRQNLAHVFADGTVDPNWKPTTNDRVRTLQQQGTHVFVGGDFTQVNGTGRTFLAELDGAGALTSFAPAISTNLSFKPGVHDLVIGGIITNQVLYLVGEFTSVTGANGSFARRRGVGIGIGSGNFGSVTGWDPDANGRITGIVGGSVGNFFLAGGFSTLNTSTGVPQSRSGMAQVSSSSGAVTSWNPVPSSTNSTAAVAVLGNTVYFGGTLRPIAGQPGEIWQAAAYDVTGTGAHLPAWHPTAVSSVKAITAVSGKIYLGGSAGGPALVGVDPANAAVQFQPVLGRGRELFEGSVVDVRAIGVSGDDVLAAGTFESVGGVARRNVAAIDLTTGRPTAFNAPMNGMLADVTRVSTLALTSDGLLWVGGNFFTEAPDDRQNLALFDATTGVQQSLDRDTDQPVRSILVNGTTVYVGGEFSSVGGAPRRGVVALEHRPGERGQVLPFDADVSGSVRSMALRGDTLYLAGGLSAVNATTESNPARGGLGAVNATTGLVLPWNPNTNGTVHSISLVGDVMYAGGDFTTVAGGAVPRGRLAAFDPNTGAPLGWDPGADGTVRSLAVNGSTVFVGGVFNSVRGESHPKLAALDASSGAPDAFGLDAVLDQTNGPTTPSVNAVAVGGGPRLVAGGTYATHSPRPLLANLAVFDLPQPPGPPAPGGGTPPENGGPGGGTPPPVLDRIAPGLTAFAATRKTFRVGPGATSSNGNATAAGRKKATPRGTTLTLMLNEAAKVKIEVLQRTTGRRVGKKCVKATKSNRKRKKCTRLVAKGSFTRSAKAGKSKIAWSGKIGRKALKPGKYTVHATPTDAAGNKGKARSLNVKIVRR